jgi:hypothetical protein
MGILVGIAMLASTLAFPSVLSTVPPVLHGIVATAW